MALVLAECTQFSRKYWSFPHGGSDLFDKMMPHAKSVAKPSPKSQVSMQCFTCKALYQMQSVTCVKGAHAMRNAPLVKMLDLHCTSFDFSSGTPQLVLRAPKRRAGDIMNCQRTSMIPELDIS